jgi:hypothetical protein
VVHGLQLSVEHDLAHHAVALVELIVSDELAVSITRSVDAKAIEGVTNEWRWLTGIALIQALPGITVVVILLCIWMSKAAIGRQRGIRIINIP